MRKLIFFLMFVLSLQTMFAADYFRNGASWYQTGKPAPTGFNDDCDYVKTYELDGDTVVDGKKCLKLWYTFSFADNNTERTLINVIHVDGDKVYFKKSRKTKEWSLLYDFGIKVGETVEVFVLPLTWPEEGDTYPNPVNLYCFAVEPSDNGDGFERIRLIDEQNRRYLGTEYEDDYTGTWISGIGSKTGFDDNCQYGWVGKASISNMIFRIGDEIIWQLNESSVEAVAGEANAENAIYDLSGRRLKEIPFNTPYISNGRVHITPRR